MSAHNKGPNYRHRKRIANEMIKFMVANGIRLDDEPIHATAGFAVAMFGNGYDGSTKILARMIKTFWIRRLVEIPEEFHDIIKARGDHYLLGKPSESRKEQQ